MIEMRDPRRISVINPIVNIEKGTKGKSKKSIKLNAQCVLSSKLDSDGTPKDISDIYNFLVSWCNDQASKGPSVRLPESIPTASTVATTESNAASDFSSNKITADSITLTSPNFEKGTVELHYEEITDDYSFAHNYVDFCIDSETLYKSLLNDEGDRTYKTDPFFASICYFFFDRNVMRVAAILAIYNTIIESLKGTIASTETSSGYYGNAIGATCALWLYGWGYYVYHGTYYKSKLMSDDYREKRVKIIRDKIGKVISNEQSSGLDQDDLRGLLEEAIELGASTKNDNILKDALRFDFSRHENLRENVSSKSWLEVIPSIAKIFYDEDVQDRLASKVGFYEMLDIAGKYLYQQRLYAKIPRNKIVENYIVVMSVLVALGVGYGWYSNLVNYISCQKNGDIEGVDFTCKSSEFGMYFQLGYVLFFINLTLNMWGIVATFSGLIYGSFICHTLVDSFMRRYKMLRKLKIPSFADIKDREFTNEEQIQIKFIETVASYLKRDCYERYIFIKTLMEQVSQIWSGLLTGILIVSSILVIFYYVIILISGTVFYVPTDVMAAIIFSTPTICCSYANSAMDLLFFKLKTSGPDDYSAIGGRDNFIEYATNTPCYWYIFGFAITPSWLAGFVGGTVSAVAASILISQFT